MVQVVLRVPYGLVLEQSEISYEDLIRPVPDLSSIPPRYRRAPILQPRLTLW